MARIEPVAIESASGMAKEIYDEIGARGGKVDNIVATMAHTPDMLKGFLTFASAINSKATLDKRLRELIILKVSKINACSYCVGAHLLIAKKLGVSSEDIDAIDEDLSLGSFTDRERVAIGYAEKVTVKASDLRDNDIIDLKKHFNDSEIVELTVLISYFNFLNRFNDALMIDVDY